MRKKEKALLKAAGYPGTSLSDAQRADLQAGVDSVHEMFKGAVVRGRLVEEWAMEGQSMMGAKARDAGLVDAVGELDDAVALARALGARVPK